MKDPAGRRIPHARPGGSLAYNVVEFCRLLRAHGIPVAPGGADVALAALQEIELGDRASFRRALRISVVQKPEDFPLFNDLFARYWRTWDDDIDPADRSGRPRPDTDGAAGEPAPDSAEAPVAEDHADEAADERFGAAASLGARVAGRRRRQASATDLSELDRLGRSLAAELALSRSRRLEPDPRGHVLDCRRLLRRSLRYGGVPVELQWRRQRIARARLLLLCDVSRSMEPHARLLLLFANALLRHAWRVEVFLFASELVRVTRRWRETPWADLTGGLAAAGGGTRLGESLGTLLDDYGFCLTGTKCTTVILSDGLDAGEPELVSQKMAALARRSHRVIWLNPLLATPGYEPVARGMAAALPHVDVFAPADGIASLWQLVRTLGRAA